MRHRIPRGISYLTDSRLPHAEGRNLKSSGGSSGSPDDIPLRLSHHVTVGIPRHPHVTPVHYQALLSNMDFCFYFRYPPPIKFAFTFSLLFGLRVRCFGLRVHIYYFPDFASTFNAFRTPRPRTSRPHLLLSGLRIHGLRVHIYCFTDSASTDFASTFTVFWTSRPNLLLPDSTSTDFASTFTVFRTSRPHLLLSELRVHVYCFSNSASMFIAFRTPCPRTSRPRTSRPRTSHPPLLLSELRVHINCF
ncbi:hypothetical protein CRG98_001205 [Punica granatum]|uniref:Uncharacterized protein n=1 Tax=Punica granatum TaxID=22663 RepID=A0A2I0LCH7_PUNGR|nr:hypothetical protein CRG98_001205 [Punica granatum]